MADDPVLRDALRSIYEEIMWLASRPNVTPGRARAWYTHIMAESVKRRIRRFTGYASRAAIQEDGPLMLEHFRRIQTALSSLVERHRTQRLVDAEEFVNLVLAYEQVHIVTRAENYAAMRAKGDYERAGITLVAWREIPPSRQRDLWRIMLRGRVANASAYAPIDPPTGTGASTASPAPSLGTEQPGR